MDKLSQRDSRWSKIPLGTSTTTTIGSHGCTITALSMLLGTTPNIVNDKLKSVGGYANTNLINWSKIKDVFSATHLERGYVYNNDKVQDAIQKYGGCLVEVDGSRIGASTHWVIYIGNKKMIDPWTGVEKDTNYYPAKGYSIISVSSTPGTMPETIQLDKQTFENLVTKATLLDSFTASGIKSVTDIEDLKRMAKESQNERNTALEEAKNTRDELSTFKTKVSEKLECPQDLSRILSAIDDTLRKLEQATTNGQKDANENEVYEKQVIELQAEITRLKLMLQSSNPLEHMTALDLLQELLKRLSNILGKA